jgi:hypothetical protein
MGLRRLFFCLVYKNNRVKIVYKKENHRIYGGFLMLGGEGGIKYTTSHHFLLLYKIACKPRIYII